VKKRERKNCGSRKNCVLEICCQAIKNQLIENDQRTVWGNAQVGGESRHSVHKLWPRKKGKKQRLHERNIATGTKERKRGTDW